jgi:hypothetical protein
MLPPEIHLVIFSRLHYHIDTTCFGLTCKRFWAIRKKLHGHRNGGKIILTCGLAMFLHGWMGDSYCWDSVSEVFLTKKAFEERCEERCRKRDEAIASYGSAYWERLVGGDLVDF